MRYQVKNYHLIQVKWQIFFAFRPLQAFYQGLKCVMIFQIDLLVVNDGTQYLWNVFVGDLFLISLHLKDFAIRSFKNQCVCTMHAVTGCHGACSK